MSKINTVGRRKAAIARVYLEKGSGVITINNKELTNYFPVSNLSNKVLEPLQTVEMDKAFDISVNVKGGGIKGQAEAIRLGVARALVELDAELKPALKAKGYMTRDSRVVERKKYGKPKARKSFQFSKR